MLCIVAQHKVNESFDEKALLRKYREEIDTLTAKLAAMETMVQQNRLVREERARGGTGNGNGSGDSDSNDDEEDNKEEIMLQVCMYVCAVVLICSSVISLRHAAFVCFIAMNCFACCRVLLSNETIID
jgi:hypothetical protein